MMSPSFDHAVRIQVGQSRPKSGRRFGFCTQIAHSRPPSLGQSRLRLAEVPQQQPTSGWFRRHDDPCKPCANLRRLRQVALGFITSASNSWMDAPGCHAASFHQNSSQLHHRAGCVCWDPKFHQLLQHATLPSSSSTLMGERLQACGDGTQESIEAPTAGLKSLSFLKRLRHNPTFGQGICS